MNKQKLRLLFSAIILAITISLTGCSQGSSSSIQGVTFSDSGKIAVTFKVPDGMTVEDVIGSELGSKNTVQVTTIGSSGQSAGIMTWYKVEKGGLISNVGDVYRYGPDSELVFVVSSYSLPALMVIREMPSDDELFNPSDTERLKEEYGISLNFGS